MTKACSQEVGQAEGADTALRVHSTRGEIVDEAVPAGGSGRGGPRVPPGSK